MSDELIEVLHVGSASRDVADDDPRGWRLGGGVTYAALTTARLGLRTAAVVGADLTAAPAHELDLLRDAGVHILVVPLAESPVFLNVEAPTGRVQTCLQPGYALPVIDLPAAWRRATAWSLVPVAGEVGDGWASVVPDDAVLAVGWQGWLRELGAGNTVERRAPAPSAVLGRADLVGVSRHDLAPATGVADLRRFLRPEAGLLVTDGERGGQLLRPDRGKAPGSWRYAAIASDGEVDPTGAGDTFLAALLAALVRPTIVPDRADGLGGTLTFAAAAASLVIEGPGLLGVPALATVRHRYGRADLDGRGGPVAAD